MSGRTSPVLALRWPRMPIRWVGVLALGAALYGGVLWATQMARDPLYIPTLLLVGAAVVPAAFVMFVNEIRLPYRLSPGVVAMAAVLGGVIGSIVAGQLETQAVRDFGSLPPLLIGLIEETAKLAIPALFLLSRRVRTVDGLLLGVTVGSGFAVLETMGYGFVSLLVHQGHLGPVTQLLVARAVAAPGGHAAWTGLACAALFAIRGSRRPGWAWVRFGSVFAGVVGLHAAWDSLASGPGFFVIGAISFAALMTATWWLRRPTATGVVRTEATGEDRADAVLAQGSPMSIGSSWGSPAPTTVSR
jgi:protease PrsW